MKRKLILKIFLSAIIVGSIWYVADHYSFQFTVKAAPKTIAAVSATSSAGDNQKKIRILIVPGHEPNDGGTNFENLYERDLMVPISQDLEQFLDTNKNYQAFITRGTQAWNPTFTDYFQNEWNQIVAWEQAAKKTMAFNIASNEVDPEIHNNTDIDVAMRLYGITKWSNENNIDLMLHLHLNNYPNSPKTTAGKYSGMVMYVPASEYANSGSSKAIADAIFKRLSLYNPIDNLPVESSGLIEDPELIALGANNTSKAASILIEYDYIYEPQFVNPEVRSIAFKDLAYQTYLGLQDFYNHNDGITATSSYYPNENVYAWNTQVTSVNSNPEDIYALQTSLIMDGDYPPKGMSRNDCPHSGTIGTCTKSAILAFQKKYGISGESAFGTKTFNLLNGIYNGKID